MAKQTAVAVKEDSYVVPAFMQEQIGLGSENLGAGDVEIPRIKLMQALSPELEEYQGVKQGEFWHTLAEQNLSNTVRVTPIYVDQSFILWRPRDSGGGILARAADGIHWSPPNGVFDVELKGGAKVTWRTAPTVAQSGLDKWGSANPNDTNSPPAATRMFNVVVVLPDFPDLPPAVVTLQRASIKVARRFLGKLKITRAPSFGLYFQMSAAEDRNNAGQKFWNYAFKADGMVQDKDEYDRNFNYYKYFKEQGVKVKDIEDVQDDEVPHEDADNGKPAF